MLMIQTFTKYLMNLVDATARTEKEIIALSGKRGRKTPKS